MYKFLFFDEPDAAAPEETPEASPAEEPVPDYSQLLYEYITSQDNLSGMKQEEYYAAYTEKLDSIDTQLQHLNSNLEWTVALLVFAIVLYLSRYVRGWVTMLTGGGMKDVL